MTALAARPAAVCTVDLGAIEHNVREVRRVVGPGVQIIAVVKANAYGHGAVPVSRALLAAGAERLAVARVDEGIELREAGIHAPIHLLGVIDPADAARIVVQRLTPMIWRIDDARALAAALPRGRRLAAHVKIDTGMHRLGGSLEDLDALLDELRELPVEIEGCYSHLASADEPTSRSADEQRVAFGHGLERLTRAGIRPALRHLANSAGILRGAEFHGDAVRPGIILYGGLPDPAFAGALDLRPAMRLTSHIVQLREIPRGEAVGYGQTFRAERTTRIAVVPVGYADGYPRSLSNRGWAMVRGGRAAVIGIVSMDHLTLDVTDVPAVATGDEVLLWGAGRAGRAGERRASNADVDMDVEVMALGRAAGTIGYELLSRLGARVRREFVPAPVDRGDSLGGT